MRSACRREPPATPACPAGSRACSHETARERQSRSSPELDFNNIGNWPREAKIGFCGLIVLLLIVGLAWFLFVSGKRDELEGLERQEADLRAEFETKQGRAANLEPLKQQLAQMEQQLQQMLRQLPSKTEMPDLIVDISQTALATGIQQRAVPARPGDAARSSTPRSRSRCGWWAATTSSAPSSAAWPRCRAW